MRNLIWIHFDAIQLISRFDELHDISPNLMDKMESVGEP